MLSKYGAVETAKQHLRNACWSVLQNIDQFRGIIRPCPLLPDKSHQHPAEFLYLNFIRVNAQQRFYDKLAGVTEPETKRKIIGEVQ